VSVLINILLLGLLSGCSVYYWIRLRPALQQSSEHRATPGKTEDQKSAPSLERLINGWRYTFDAINDPIFIVDRELVVLKANKAALEVFSSGNETLLGVSVRKISGLHQLPATFWPSSASQAEVQALKTEIKNKNLNRLYSVSCTPIVDDGAVLGYIHVCQDFTRQRKLEQQLVQAHKMDAIATLAGGIAHDFNNILGAILGNADLLLYRLQPPETAHDFPGNQQKITHHEIVEHVDSIKRAGHRAKELVAQILAFGRQSNAQHKKLDMAPFIKEGCKLLRSSLPATIEMRVNIPASVGSVFGDPIQIQQVLMNLGNNAAQSLDNFTGKIEIALEERTIEEDDCSSFHELHPGTYVVLTVKDTGKGIPEEELQRIFDPFFTTRDVGDGTGMGLSVLHGIVVAHDGVVDVKSEPGKGTVFNVFFPCIIEKEAVDEDLIATMPGGAESILFVDDEEELVTMRKRMLEFLGYTVYPSTSPQGALALVQQGTVAIDLLITDLTMPKMTGLELAREVHKSIPQLPVVLCSGYSEPVSAEEAERAGIQRFLSKPHDMQLMAVAIREIFAEQKKEQV